MTLDPHAAAILKPEKRKPQKGRARGADVPTYGVSPATRWKGDVERIPNPIRQSIIDLVKCRCCREYQLEGSKALGYCRTCGTVNG